MGMLEEARRYLIDQGLVEGSTGWSAFIGQMPRTPDKVVGLFRYGGNPPDQRDEEGQCEYPGLQVRVRATHEDYAIADAKICQIGAVLHRSNGLTFDGVHWPWVEAVASPFPIGPDESGRPELVENFILAREMPQ